MGLLSLLKPDNNVSSDKLQIRDTYRIWNSQWDGRNARPSGMEVGQCGVNYYNSR